jgi:hypothetical protein
VARDPSAGQRRAGTGDQSWRTGRPAPSAGARSRLPQ